VGRDTGPSATTNGNPDNGQDNNGMYDLDHDGGHEHTEGSVAMRDEDGNGPGGDRDHNHNEDGQADNDAKVSIVTPFPAATYESYEVAKSAALGRPSISLVNTASLW